MLRGTSCSSCWVAKLENSVKSYTSITPQTIPQQNHVELKCLAITPTQIIENSRLVRIDFSNRVFRHYKEHIDNDGIIEVRFCDENLDDLSSINENKGPIIERIRSYLEQGVKYNSRTYEFLGGSGSKLKENEYYFSEQSGFMKRWILSIPTVDAIHNWMGDFSKLKNGAQRFSRMAQCFSSTEVVQIQVEIENANDVTSKSHPSLSFTDGAGTASSAVFEKIAEMQQTPSGTAVVQIRCGGYKGTISLDPTLKGNKVRFPQSMRKFDCKVKELDIIGRGRWSPFYTNRFFIMNVSARGVPNDAFKKFQDDVIQQTESMFRNREVALRLSKQMNIEEITGLLENEKIKMDDFFVKRLLQALQQKVLKKLRKSKILVEKAACLMGTSDETKTLKNKQVYFCRDGGKPHVGKVIIFKNPCISPDGIVEFEAVDTPKLSHKRNCLVFSQLGDLPPFSNCSNGDLDGDVYSVIWDSTLFPNIPRQNENSHIEKQYHEEEPTNGNVIKFILDFMVKNNTGQIANNLLATADQYGALDERAKKLQQLYQKAVSYEKTGIPAELPYELKCEKYPDYMEIRYKDSYESDNIIGILYRGLPIWRSIDARPFFNKPFTSRNKISEIIKMRDQYNKELKEIMVQFQIEFEFQIVSGILTNSKKTSKSMKGNAKIIRERYKSLQEEYKKKFDDFKGEPEQKAKSWFLAVFVGKTQIESTDLVSFAYIGREHLSLYCGRNWDVKSPTLDNVILQDV